MVTVEGGKKKSASLTCEDDDDKGVDCIQEQDEVMAAAGCEAFSTSRTFTQSSCSSIVQASD